MRKLKNPFKDLNKVEWTILIISLTMVTLSFIFTSEKSILNLIASLVGVTALIFIAKGYVVGQFLIIIFALLYGVISFEQKYYGEMATYVFMSAPMAVVSIISWLRHPYKGGKVVKVNKMTKKQILFMVILNIVVTVVFYFILKYLGTNNLLVSTISITTTFSAVYMTYMRSPYYALGYVANDIVLIVLWVLSSIKNPSYIPVVVCFSVFLLNDIYGFISWKRMEKLQRE
jgi:nicotinamide mononucleotide transporter PnuC